MDFKTKKDGKLVQLSGELKVLSGGSNKYLKKVELWLLNDKTNRNDWRYEKLDEHRKLFADTPILVAYVGNKIGDGHNFTEEIDENGEVSASFLAATAERIVGWFREESDIRIEIKDGKKWVVGTGYIWAWYAKELVALLKEQGAEGMAVSIETLVYNTKREGTTEVYDKYEILGTTILGKGVAPAVAGANIKALSAIGVNGVREMTLRVASQYKEELERDNQQEANKKTNPQIKQNKTKGVTKMANKEIRSKFPDSTIIGSEGKYLVLLSADGNSTLTTYEKVDGQDVFGAKSDIAINAYCKSEDGTEIPVSIDEIVNAYTDRNNALTAELEETKKLLTAQEKIVAKMQSDEHERRVETVKNAINARYNEIVTDSNVAIDKSICDGLLTAEKVEYFSKCEDCDHKFIGDKEAVKELDALCMNEIIAHNKKKEQARNNTKLCDLLKNNSADENEDNAIAAMARLTKATNVD